MPLISIVIPVYNVEKYLDRCIETVLAQTYKEYEVILVDDGSTDNSGLMCDAYSKRDSRIRTYHKPNGGLSDARNFGVKVANGRLISFVDSDDYICIDYLEHLYRIMQAHDADVSSAGVVGICLGEKRESALVRACIKQRSCNATEAVQIVCYYGVHAVARLYKRELLLECPYPVGELYEDLATTYRIMGQCKTAVFSSKPIYYYIEDNNSSITHTVVDERHMRILTIADNLFEYIRKNFPKAIDAAHIRCAISAIFLVPRILSDKKNGKKYFHQIRSFLKPHMKAVFFDQKKSISCKIACLAIILGYYPTKLLWLIGEKAKITHN